MSDTLKQSNAKGLDVGSAFLKDALSDFSGEKEATAFLNEIALYGAPKKFPDPLVFAFLFGDIKLIWQPVSNSFVSTGRLGLISIGKNPINRYYKGIIEIKKHRSGDELNLYIELDDSNWYYFNYQGNILQVISSVEAYNTRLSALKDKDRMFRGGDQKYEFVISTNRKKVEFLREMQDRNLY